MSFDDFTDRVVGLIKDQANKLSADDLSACIKQAIQQRYSKDRPLEKAEDSVGSGTNLIDLPAEFEDGYSLIRQVEFPVDEIPPALLDDNAWGVYRGTAGLKLMLYEVSVQASESVRLTFTQRHASDGTTVPGADFDAVCDYAASLAFEILAAIYTQTSDPLIAADVVNYRSKGQEYLNLAKAARKRYFDHVGVIDDAFAASSSGGVGIAMGELDNNMGWGGDRLTHGSKTR